ncbi:MAG: tetratricopeptide repeat protein [Cyanobacteria bacterium P01_H01_bin.74]
MNQSTGNLRTYRLGCITIRSIMALKLSLAGSCLVASTGLAVLVSGSMTVAEALSPQGIKLYNQARLSETEGDLQAAEKALRRSITLEPKDAMNLVKLASVLRKLGRPNEAVQYYQQAIAQNPHDAMLHYGLGSLFEQLGDYSQAEVAYKTALQKNPRYQFGLFNLSRTQIQQQDYRSAIATTQQFLKSYPSHYEAGRRLAALYRATRQDQLAVQSYRQLKRQFPNQFSEQLQFAKALHATGQRQEAVTELETYAVQPSGSSAEVQEELGHLYAELNKPYKAIQAYRKAVEKDPENNQQLLLAMGDIFQDLNEFAEAASFYKQFLVETPGHLPAQKALVNCYLAMKDFEASKQALNQYLTLLTQPSGSNIEVGSLSNPKMLQAEQYLREKDLGYVNQMLGDSTQAIQHYEALLKTARGQADLQLKNNLAIAYVQTQQFEKAVPLYKRIDLASDAEKQAAQVDPNAVHRDLSLALMKQGELAARQNNLETAVTLLEDAARYAPADDPEPFVLIGNTYFDMGQLKQADNAYRQALLRQADHVDAKLNRAKIALLLKDAKNSPAADIKTPPQDNLPNSLKSPLSPLDNRISISDQNQNNDTGKLTTGVVPGADDDLEARNNLSRGVFSNAIINPNALNLNAMNTEAVARREADRMQKSTVVPPKKKLSSPAILQTPESIESPETEKQITQTISSLKTLATQNPENFDVWVTLADAYSQQNDPENAIAAYNKALALSPENTDILILIGAQWKAQGNLAQARDTFLQAASLDSSRADVFYNLGIVHNELKAYPESIQAYEKALGLDPALVQARYGLAISLDQSKQFTQASKQYAMVAMDSNGPFSTAAKQRVEALKEVVKPKAIEPKKPVQPLMPIVQPGAQQAISPDESAGDFQTGSDTPDSNFLD